MDVGIIVCHIIAVIALSIFIYLFLFLGLPDFLFLSVLSDIKHCGCNAKQIRVLLPLKCKSEHFDSVGFNGYDLDLTFLIDSGLETEGCDELCDHFEVHDSKSVVDNVAEHINVGLLFHLACKG